MKNICVVCGKRFETARSDARYCSNACAKKASRSGKTAKKEKELAEIAYQQAHAQEIARQRREKEREEREWQMFLKEYNAFCENENAKQQVRDRVSQIVSAVKQKAEEREKRIREEEVRIEHRRTILARMVDVILQQPALPEYYKRAYNVYKKDFDIAIERYAVSHRDLKVFCLPISDERKTTSIDDEIVSFMWFSFFDRVDYWFNSRPNLKTLDISEWRYLCVSQLIQ